MKYVAEDGKEFTTAKSCLNYEENLVKDKKILEKIVLSRSELNEITKLSEVKFELLSSIGDKEFPNLMFERLVHYANMAYIPKECVDTVEAYSIKYMGSLEVFPLPIKSTLYVYRNGRNKWVSYETVIKEYEEEIANIRSLKNKMSSFNTTETK